jgi:hypothetical protein
MRKAGMQEGMSWFVYSFSCLPEFLIQDLMAPPLFGSVLAHERRIAR